jgi:N-acetylneuraminic acid mutarotase
VDTTIYSYGGYNSDTGFLDDTYSLDTDTTTWTKMKVTGEKPAPRAACGLCATEEKVMVFGGVVQNAINGQQNQEGATSIPVRSRHVEKLEVNNEFYELILATGEWRSVRDSGDRPAPRYGHTLAAVEQKVILFGGEGADGAKLADLHVFDMGTKVYRLLVKRDALQLGLWCPWYGHCAVKVTLMQALSHMLDL